jgi:hypothetical protein
MTTLLQELKIAEVSVVDLPANDLPGYMLLKSANGIKKATSEFVTILRDIRKRQDWTDDEKLAAARKAVDAAPPQIAQPALEELAMEQAIITEYGLTEKTRHPESGRPIPQAEAVRPKAQPAEKRSLVPWRHGGAAIIR